MELNEFIKETIIQISDGIYNAGLVIQKQDSHINPAQTRLEAASANAIKSGNIYAKASFIDFEIGLTQTSDKGNKSGIGVVLGNVTLGSTASTGTNNSSVTKVKFSVPIVFPSL